MIPKITVHCIVKNEEKWIWYAIESIRNIAQEILIYDTGSTDKTVEIIKTFRDKKIKFEEKGSVDSKGLVSLRRQQLKRTKTEWFLILDGDEIWSESAKKELVQKLKTANSEDWGVVIRAWNFIGDVYHLHPESALYHWPYAPKDYIGWANLRIIKTSTPGLNITGNYPLEAYCDSEFTPIQNYGLKHLIFLNNRYYHTTYLVRSTNRKADKTVLNRLYKNKQELGTSVGKNFIYPQAFFKKAPSIVDNPWRKRSALELAASIVQTPIKETRRRIFNLYNPR